jgi:hypothetical protein
LKIKSNQQNTNGDKMSHYTNQNPISEQAWINSVLGQMGRSESSKCNESNQEVSELVDSINKLSNILSSNNNNLPTDPIAMEEFVEKLDVLGDLIGNLMEADEADEEPSKSKKVFISKPTGKGIRLQGRKHSPEAINQALLARAKQKVPEKRTEQEKALVAKEQERLKREKEHKAKVEKEIADGTRKRGQPKMTRMTRRPI